MNPYWPYYLSNTVEFTYHGKKVLGTIMRFGNGFWHLLTKDGYRNYRWDRIDGVTMLYQCSVSELIKMYQYHGDQRYKYLHDHYGPYVPPYPWKED
jgi:hypothetical protein